VIIQTTSSTSSRFAAGVIAYYYGEYPFRAVVIAGYCWLLLVIAGYCWQMSARAVVDEQLGLILLRRGQSINRACRCPLARRSLHS
jgi:hypothetical protein